MNEFYRRDLQVMPPEKWLIEAQKSFKLRRGRGEASYYPEMRTTPALSHPMNSMP